MFLLKLQHLIINIKFVLLLGNTARIFNLIQPVTKSKELIDYFWPILTAALCYKKCCSFDKAIKKRKVQGALLTHKTSRIVGIGTYFAVNFDKSLHYNLCNLAVS